MNTKLVESLITIIESLSREERTLLEEKLFLEMSYPNPEAIAQLADSSGTFDFLNCEPDLYTLSDGEKIK